MRWSRGLGWCESDWSTVTFGIVGRYRETRGIHGHICSLTVLHL